jgi:hypothetical protein
VALNSLSIEKPIVKQKLSNHVYRYEVFNALKYQGKSEQVIFAGHDRMVVGFTTTYAISAYHH